MNLTEEIMHQLVHEYPADMGPIELGRRIECEWPTINQELHRLAKEGRIVQTRKVDAQQMFAARPVDESRHNIESHLELRRYRRIRRGLE